MDDYSLTDPGVMEGRFWPGRLLTGSGHFA